jgi:hypothetical protein
MTKDLEERLRAYERPEPPREMRARVLAATAPLVQGHDSRLDRLWFSRTWRMAAVVAVVAVAGIESVSGGADGSAPQISGRTPESAQVTVQAALELGFSPTEAAALALKAIPATTFPEPPPGIKTIF